MRALEVFGFKHYLSGPSDHPVDAPDGTSESMLSSGISRNIFIWVLVRVVIKTSAATHDEKKMKVVITGNNENNFVFCEIEIMKNNASGLVTVK
jgi:hypothetical protein